MSNIVDLLLKPSIPRALRQNSCLALNQIELDATNRKLVILGTKKYDKAEYPAKMRDMYCLGWQCRQMCLSATPLKRQTFLFVADV
jgi:hypothetical protein